jgi:hypothetical protein
MDAGVSCIGTSDQRELHAAQHGVEIEVGDIKRLLELFLVKMQVYGGVGARRRRARHGLAEARAAPGEQQRWLAGLWGSGRNNRWNKQPESTG